MHADLTKAGMNAELGNSQARAAMKVMMLRYSDQDYFFQIAKWTNDLWKIQHQGIKEVKSVCLAMLNLHNTAKWSSQVFGICKTIKPKGRSLQTADIMWVLPEKQAEIWI